MAYKPKYKYKWRYTDEDIPQGGIEKFDACYDCRMSSREFPDMVIPNDMWEEINPTYHKGSGTLCPTCIANRLDYVGKWYEGNLYILTTSGEFGEGRADRG